MLLLRRIAIMALALLVQTGHQPAAAQTIKRIETLWATTQEAASPYVKALEEGLVSHGWILGKTLIVRHNFTDARPEKLELYASEIVARKPDLIWASLNPGAVVLKRLTSTIPIVIGNSVDPVGVGLVQSIHRPGGNITGVIAADLEVYGKRMQLLHQILPQIRSVGFLYNADSPGILSGIDVADRAAKDLKLRVIRGGMNAPGQIQAAFARLLNEGAQSLYVVSDNLTFLHRQEIADMAIAARLPTISQVREFCEAGMLVCYSSSLKAQFQRSAFMVDRVLKGASPGSLPLEQPTRFELVVNMRTAQALEIQFDRAILSQVQDIIE